MRFTTTTAPGAYDALVAVLDGCGGGAGAARRRSRLWQIVAELASRRALDRCAVCHGGSRSSRAVFSHPAGGVLCDRARARPGSRSVRRGACGARAVDARRGAEAGGAGAVRAHQRLLREFLREHLADGRPMRAFELWERERWNEPTPVAP
jgi:DNA repair protein RecO (recombination protein O)